MTRIGITVSQKFDSSNLIKLLEKFGATHELLSSNTNIENSEDYNNLPILVLTFCMYT